MTDEDLALIRYWQNLSCQTLNDARALFGRESLQSAVNRCYYACFYCVLALLRTRNLASAKHTGVQALFLQHFVKTEIIPRDLGRYYAKLFDKRLASDYAPMPDLSAEEVRALLEQADDFVVAVSKATDKSISEHS